MSGMVDYTLAKHALLRAFRTGTLSRVDVCDAHPDLLRAATHCGEPTREMCPVCSRTELRLVSYAFSDDLKRDNGRVWPREDVAGLMAFREARLYTVEVCTDCSWNHLRSQIALSNDSQPRGRKASP